MAESRHLWFKARRYGWGWIPVTWQGWVIFAVYLLVVAACAILLLPANADSVEHTVHVVSFCLLFLSATLIFVGICYAKGEMPRWQWGEKEKKHGKS